MAQQKAKRTCCVQDSSVPVLILAFICVSFLALRLPVLYLLPGGQDEDCYAVPGLEVLRSGLPRMPHIPARHPESVFYMADKALYSEPPGYFYLQAAFYAVLPTLCGTGRLVSAAAAVVSLILIFRLTVQSGGRGTAALWAAGLFSLSRWMLFPATSARPDMLCSMFGLLGIGLTFHWRETRSYHALIAVGICIGLGGLTHPFAMVYAIQLALWVGFASSGWNRIHLPLLLAVVAVAVTSLWLPLIRLYPEIFRIQFTNQFLSGTGGSLVQRLLLPWESIQYHWFTPQGMIAHIGIWQILLAFVPLTAMSVHALRSRDVGSRTISLLAWSSLFLMCVIVGPHHPVIGYWGYSAALMFVAAGRFVDNLISFMANRYLCDLTLRMRKTVIAVAGAMILLSLVPGAGVRTVFVLMKQRNNVNYNAPMFAKRLIDSLPSQAVVAVDTQFVFDFVAHRRSVLLATRNPSYLRLEDFEYDYLVVSRAGIDTDLVKGLPVVLERTYGNREDPFACYSEVYRYVRSD